MFVSALVSVMTKGLEQSHDAAVYLAKQLLKLQFMHNCHWLARALYSKQIFEKPSELQIVLPTNQKQSG